MYIIMDTVNRQRSHTTLYQSASEVDKLMLLRASLDLPTSVNLLYENRKGGGKRLSEAARAWRDSAVLILRSANTWKDDDAIERARSSQSMLAFHIQAFIPSSRILRRDIDNMAKLCQDTVMRTLGIDDRHIFDLHISKRPLPQKQAAFILVALSELGAD